MSASTPSDPFILENTDLSKGGPARHLHYNQDEWFYVLEGSFKFEVGAERFHLQPGDSLLAPRQVPHVWAFVGEAHGRILVAFFPGGNMEAFFREVTRANAMPAQDPALWRAHGMESASAAVASRVRAGAPMRMLHEGGQMVSRPLLSRMRERPTSLVTFLWR